MQVWDADTGECVQSGVVCGEGTEVSCVATHGGSIAAGCSTGAVVVWGAQASPPDPHHLGCHTGPVSCIVSGGALVVSGSLDGSVALWRRSSKGWAHQCTVHGHTKGVSVLSLCTHAVVSGSFDCTLHVISLATGARLHTLYGHTGALTALQATATLVVSGCTQGPLHLWHPATGATLGTLVGHRGRVVALACTPVTSAQCLVASVAHAQCRVWDGALLVCLHVLPLDPNGPPPVLAMHGGLVGVVGLGGVVVLHEAVTGACVQRVPVGAAGPVWFLSLDARGLVCAGGGGVVVVRPYAPATDKSL